MAALSRYHGKMNVPMSRLLTFEDGSDEVLVQCYLHTSAVRVAGVVWAVGTEGEVEPAG